MKLMKAALLNGIVLMFFLAQTAQAEIVEIKGVGVKFSPMVTQAKPGDSIAFRNMASHYVESIDSMTPSGGQKNALQNG